MSMNLIGSLKRNAREIVVAIAACAVASICIFLGVLWGLSKSDWAAWVQAVGSVAAVLVAVWIVQLQHQREAKFRLESERSVRRRQLSALRWVFNSVAESCEKAAAKVHREHVAWHLEAEVIAERRRLLASVNLAEFPDASLLIRAQEITHQLQLANAVVEALDQPRKESVRVHVAEMLRATRDSALAGVTEATKLFVTCSTTDELAAEWKMLDCRTENEAMAKRVYEELNDASPSA